MIITKVIRILPGWNYFAHSGNLDLGMKAGARVYSASVINYNQNQYGILIPWNRLSLLLSASDDNAKENWSPHPHPLSQKDNVGEIILFKRKSNYRNNQLFLPALFFFVFERAFTLAEPIKRISGQGKNYKVRQVS